MKKNHFMPKMMSRTLLIAFVSFLCASSSVAQESVAEKIANAKSLFSHQLTAMNDEYGNKVVDFFESCTKSQKEEILSYMVQAITDSLKANKKEFAMNYIDYYRLIADSNDDYLPSLVVTEAKMHYDNMNEKGINELITFMKETNAKSSTNFDTEIANLEEMKNEIVQSYEDMQGCWLMYNSNEKFLYPQEIITISKNKQDLFNVSFVDPQIANLQSMGGLGSALLSIWNVPPGGVSDTCYFTTPKQLFYFYSSEKLRKGSETASSILRSGVRSAGNTVIGQLARSENFSTQLFGWFGVIGAEGIFNMLIDELAISRKKWILREGYLTLKDRTQIDIRYTYFLYKMNSEKTTLSAPKIIEVKSILYRYPDNGEVVFIDELRNLISDHPFSAEEQIIYYREHPDVKKASKSKKKRKLYNEVQWEKLKEYNRVHKECYL